MQEEQKPGYQMVVQDYFPTTIAKVHVVDRGALNIALYDCINRWRRTHLSRPIDRAPKAGWNIKNGWEIGPTFFDVFAGEPSADALRLLVEQSALQFVNDHHLQLRQFSKVQRAVACEIGASYATILEENAFLTDEHVHYGTDFVGVYYVRVPSHLDGRDDGAGFLVLRDPRPAMHVTRLDHQKTIEIIRPEEGMLILFPGYISHAVRPFWGKGERISINFNLTVTLLTGESAPVASEVALR